MEKRALVPIADGSEELEAVAIIDVLRRAGAVVTIASVDRLEVIASKGIRLIADRLLVECVRETFDLIVLPGGMPGAEHLRDSANLIDMLKQQAAAGRLYGAICAAPAVALYPHGLLAGHKATCHPNFVHLVQDVEMLPSPVVVDGNCVTSRGAGTAVEFALTLVEMLYGKEKVREVSRGMARSE